MDSKFYKMESQMNIYIRLLSEVNLYLWYYLHIYNFGFLCNPWAT